MRATVDKAGVTVTVLDRKGRQFLCSFEDVDLLVFTWRVWFDSHKTPRVVRTIHTRELPDSPKTERLAVVVARRLLGEPAFPSVVVHSNGDTLDCRRFNLEYRTKSEVVRAARPTFKWADRNTGGA